MAYTIISSIRIVAKEDRTRKYIISLFVFASGCSIVFFHINLQMDIESRDGSLCIISVQNLGCKCGFI